MSEPGKEFYEMSAEQMGYRADRVALPGERSCAYCDNITGFLVWDDEGGELDVCFEHSGIDRQAPVWEYGYSSPEFTRDRPDYVHSMRTRAEVVVAVRMSSQRRPMRRYMGGQWEAFDASLG